METWHHTCGYPILVSSAEKQGREVRVFFDSDPHWAQSRVTDCPGCDRPLLLSNLQPELEHDDEDEDDA